MADQNFYLGGPVYGQVKRLNFKIEFLKILSKEFFESRECNCTRMLTLGPLAWTLYEKAIFLDNYFSREKKVESYFQFHQKGYTNNNLDLAILIIFLWLQFWDERRVELKFVEMAREHWLVALASWRHWKRILMFLSPDHIYHSFSCLLSLLVTCLDSTIPAPI